VELIGVFTGQLGHMKTIVPKSYPGITSVYPTSFMEMISKRTKKLFDRASDSVLKSWKVRSRR
jgi:hypothetical protein